MVAHTPVTIGGPCAKCGLRCNRKTAYVSCFENGDTFATWKTRQPEEIQTLLGDASEAYEVANLSWNTRQP